MTEPLKRKPVTDALLARMRGAGLAVDYGNIPVDGSGTPVEVPYYIVEPSGHTYDGPPFGDRYGSAVWGYQIKAVSNGTDAAEMVADAANAALFTRGPDGRYTPPLTIIGQAEWGREPDPAGFRPGVSAEGIVTLVQRVTIRTQRT